MRNKNIHKPEIRNILLSIPAYLSQVIVSGIIFSSHPNSWRGPNNYRVVICAIAESNTILQQYYLIIAGANL